MAARTNARKQSFSQYLRSSIVALQQSVISAQAARDETKATSWGRLVHCCTALGYALAHSGVVVLLAAWLSTWGWVRRNDDGEPSVDKDALAALIGGVLASAYTLCAYCNIAKSIERPGGRSGPRYARLVLVIGAVMCPAGYGFLWGLEHETGIDAWYSLVHPPTLFIWIAFFIVMELGGRQKWSEHDRRKNQAGGAEAGGGVAADAIVAAPGGAAPGISAQPSSFIADTLVSLIVVLATMSVAALCECSPAPAKANPQRARAPKTCYLTPAPRARPKQTQSTSSPFSSAASHLPASPSAFWSTPCCSKPAKQ